MSQFRAVRESVSNMRAAVASLEAVVHETGGASVELAEWTARQRVQRGTQPLPIVSSSAPRSALAAWTAEQERRFDRRAEMDARKPAR